MTTPSTDLSATARPEESQPRATMVHVFTWPTTVLDTGPVWAMIKNWDILIMQAQKPDWFWCTSVNSPEAACGEMQEKKAVAYHYNKLPSAEWYFCPYWKRIC